MELCEAFKYGSAVLFYIVYFLRSVLYVNGLEQHANNHDRPSQDVSKPEEFLFFYQGVEGTPGVDFPVYSHIPITTFSCKGLESGYYADLDTDCQVFHICEEEKKISFLCPNGTIFQQSDLICEWWFKVNCSNSPYLYEESAENLRENTARRKLNRKVLLTSQEKTSTQLKENNFVGEVANKKFNEQYFNKKRANHVGPSQSKTYNSDYNFENIKNYQLYPQTTNKPVVTKNNYIITQKPSVLKNSSRNKILISNFSKEHTVVNQKRRRFNENELGNYENIDNDKFASTQTTTFTTPTENYLENVEKTHEEYQFTSTTSGLEDITNRKVLDVDDKSSKENLSLINQHFNHQSYQKKQTAGNSNEKLLRKSKTSETLNSDESQVPQETASFLKSSFNSIYETSSRNPFPNHRTTYADIKTIPHVSTKLYSTISSVTPQYITTQPINNGKPFLGSRVGGKTKSHKDPLFINPQIINNNTKVDKSLDADDVFRVHFLSTAENKMTNSSLVTPKMLEKILFAKIKPIDESTTLIFKETTEKPLTLEDLPTTTETIVTARKINSASKNNVNNSSLKKHSKLTSVTTKPFLIQLEDSPDPIKTLITKSTTGKSRIQDYAVIYGSYSSTTPASFPSNEVQVKFNKTVNRIGIQLGKSFGSPPPRPISVVKSIDQVKTKNVKQSTSNPKPSTVSEDQNKEEILLRHSSNTIRKSYRDNDKIKTTSSSFYETKNQEFLSTTPEPIENLINGRIYNITIRSTTQQPRPFQKFLNEDSPVTSFDNDVKNYFDYKISTASPFKSLSTPQPTLPTSFFTSTTTIDEHVDNMIDVLAAISKEKEISNGNSRPGLVVPPSVGPQTLHTLAVYFANALDKVIAQKAKTSETYPQNFMMENKEKLTSLLTQMTVHGYNQLFNQKQVNNDTKQNSFGNDDNKNQTAKDNFKLENPQIRQLARNFTVALSAYLHDPEMFRKDLENFRPTEPPFEIETTTEFSVVDEELLNYSDADTKTSHPPIFTTSQAPVPTWGFLIAAKSPNSVDVDNVIGSDLNTADTQSFIPGLNSINSNTGKELVKDKKELPNDHWTTSTSATELWKNTFSIDPSLVNDEFDSTPPLLFDVSTEVEFTTPENLPVLEQSRDVNYELRGLPNFLINSSEVSGILIDFMNNSTDDSSNKLHRILRKLNTTEHEFLVKMKEIESNPVTRRLILLLISECGKNVTEQNIKKTEESLESLEPMESNPLHPTKFNKQASQFRHNSFNDLLGSNLKEDDQDTRALQLLNTLYSIASKLGK